MASSGSQPFYQVIFIDCVAKVPVLDVYFLWYNNLGSDFLATCLFWYFKYRVLLEIIEKE